MSTWANGATFEKATDLGAGPAPYTGPSLGIVRGLALPFLCCGWLKPSPSILACFVVVVVVGGDVCFVCVLDKSFFCSV